MKLPFIGLIVALSAIGVSRADDLYLSSVSDGVVLRYDSQGTATTFAIGGSVYGANGLAFDRAGNLFAAAVSSLLRFDPTGHPTVINNSFLDAVGIATDSLGTIFVGDYRGNAIYRLDPSGSSSLFATMLAPFGLAFDSANNLYVSQADKIFRFDPQGHSSVFASGLRAATTLAFDRSDNLFASIALGNSTSNSIIKFDRQGNPSRFADVGGSIPVGLAFDSEGYLYASLSGTNRVIERYDPDGHGTVFADTHPLRTPNWIAFAPVPEPSTPALTALGAAAVWLRHRRKRSRWWA